MDASIPMYSEPTNAVVTTAIGVSVRALDVKLALITADNRGNLRRWTDEPSILSAPLDLGTAQPS